jgi:hypothetical protein
VWGEREEKYKALCKSLGFEKYREDIGEVIKTRVVKIERVSIIKIIVKVLFA